MPIISCCLLHGVPMVAEEVYCSIAPDGVSIFYDFFKVFYLLSSSRRLHRLSDNLTARDYIRAVIFNCFYYDISYLYYMSVCCPSSAGYQSGLHKSRDVRECQPGVTTGESCMFQALVVPDWYPVVPSVSR